ncbi:hypothetical protein CJU89_5392 [Yarrowia sp. B02]|nr:hypothetical protein CJU89_5392 [Yarrowia sp. B02]
MDDLWNEEDYAIFHKAHKIAEDQQVPWDQLKAQTVGEKLAMSIILLTKVRGERKELINESVDFLNSVKTEKEAARSTMKLPVPATKEQCKAVLDELSQEHARISKNWIKQREDIVRKLKEHQASVARVIACFVDIRELVGHTEFLAEYLHKLVFLHTSTAKKLADRELGYREKMDSLLLQSQMHDLLAGQEKSLIKQVWQEFNNSSEHLDRKDNRPEVDVANKGGVNLPFEIATLVYSHCDLESCVSLREASSYWYHAYAHAEHALKPALLKRFPWFKPEGEMQTWGDCVLVYISRLASKKWKNIKGWDDITIPPPKRVKLVTALEFKHGENLPKSYEGFDDHREYDCSFSCDTLHVENLPQSALLDPWTQNTQLENPSKIKVVSEGEDGLVITFMGIEITLPSFVRREDLPKNTTFCDRAPIFVNSDIIMIETPNMHFVFPRDKPHFAHASLYPPHADAVSRVGNIFVTRYEWGTYGLHDPHGKQLVKYGNAIFSKNNALPEENYNGLVWWFLGDKHLVPTFLDLDNPDKVYCREDLIITLPDKAPDGLHQCLRPENSRYLTDRTEYGGIRMVDLDQGVVTDVEKAGEAIRDESRVFLGYENGKFLARFMSAATVRHYIKDYWGLDSDDLDTEGSDEEYSDDDDYSDDGEGGFGGQDVDEEDYWEDDDYYDEGDEWFGWPDGAPCPDCGGYHD